MEKREIRRGSLERSDIVLGYGGEKEEGFFRELFVVWFVWILVCVWGGSWEIRLER